jgi:hypothetical protein
VPVPVHSGGGLAPGPPSLEAPYPSAGMLHVAPAMSTDEDVSKMAAAVFKVRTYGCMDVWMDKQHSVVCVCFREPLETVCESSAPVLSSGRVICPYMVIMSIYGNNH